MKDFGIPLKPELQELQNKLPDFIVKDEDNKPAIHFWSKRLNSDKTSALMITLDTGGAFITVSGGKGKGISGAYFTIDEAAQIALIFAFITSFVANPGKYVRLN